MSPIDSAVARAATEPDYGVSGGGDIDLESRIDALDDALKTPGEADGCVRLLDDWSGISEQDALLLSFGLPVALPVGLHVHDLAPGFGEAAKAAAVAAIDAA